MPSRSVILLTFIGRRQANSLPDLRKPKKRGAQKSKAKK